MSTVVGYNNKTFILFEKGMVLWYFRTPALPQMEMEQLVMCAGKKIVVKKTLMIALISFVHLKCPSSEILSCTE